MKKILIPAIIFIFSSVFFTNCKKDKGDPPILPPYESMLINFDNFSAAPKSLELMPGQKGTVNSSWQFAATVAGVWKLILSTTLAVPVTAFGIAVNKTPVNIGTKTWQWSYDVAYLNNTYKAKLTGQIGASDVQWKMYVSKEGTDAFSEFVWFEGTSKIDGSSGKWILYQDPQLPVTFLQIDWVKTSTEIGNIKYTYQKSDPFNGSFIEYGLTTGALNAFYNIHYYTGVKFSDVNVEWNTTAHNGRVKSIDYLGDNSWYCWDINRVNVQCQ